MKYLRSNFIIVEKYVHSQYTHRHTLHKAFQIIHNYLSILYMFYCLLGIIWVIIQFEDCNNVMSEWREIGKRSMATIQTFYQASSPHEYQKDSTIASMIGFTIRLWSILAWPQRSTCKCLQQFMEEESGRRMYWMEVHTSFLFSSTVSSIANITEISIVTPVHIFTSSSSFICIMTNSL